MRLSQLEYLRYILDETEYLISDSRGLRRDRFMRSETLKRAFVEVSRSLGRPPRK